ncbi:MAG: phosphoglucosamine mutase [Phycisphaerae bacterium]
MAVDRLMVSVSGVRGTIGKTLTPQIACEFGCAFGTMLGAGTTVVIGRDTRPSGAMVRASVAAGLMATGVSVVDLGVVTTPGVALMTRKLNADGGVIITASHNPPAYNGIKFLQPSGPGLRATEAARLKGIWEAKQFSFVPATECGTETADDTTHEKHIAATCDIVDVDAIKARKFKVVVDSINGAGCTVTPMLLERLGCEVVHLNGEPTGDFAHVPEPIEENLGGLCKAVAESGAVVGFAQDPDADRLVLVDENGMFIGEEYTLALTTAYVLNREKVDIATNLATSRMVDDLAGRAGTKVFRSPTGEANVVEAMEANGCPFGGEGNGGVIDPRVVPVRDSLVGMAMILQYLADTGKTLSQLATEIPSYTLVKTKMPCPAGLADSVAAETRKMFEGRDDVTFNDADGLRIDLPSAWLCVRASNTEPIMRIFAEAPDADEAQELVDRVKAVADSLIR